VNTKKIYPLLQLGIEGNGYVTMASAFIDIPSAYCFGSACMDMASMFIEMASVFIDIPSAFHFGKLISV